MYPSEKMQIFCANSVKMVENGLPKPYGFCIIFFISFGSMGARPCSRIRGAIMSDYRIFTDATSDLTEALLSGLPKVEVIPMPVRIGDTDYLYGPGGDITVKQFYELQRSGLFASTAGINPFTYETAFEPVLAEGLDILYLCFSSGLSGMIQSARLCIDELSERYPERRIVCIDTLCASAGEGFLVLEAARKQAEGLSLDALIRRRSSVSAQRSGRRPFRSSAAAVVRSRSCCQRRCRAGIRPWAS